MITWHLYDLKSGHFDGRSFTGATLEAISANVPDGFAAVAGVADWRSQRVEIKTGSVIDWQPPAPADDAMRTWAWNQEVRRWVDLPTLRSRKADRLARLQSAINAQEAAQARPVRELLAAMLAGGQADQVARARFTEIAAAIADLQQKRAAVEAAASDAELDGLPD